MLEIRNPDGRLIAKHDPKTGILEVKINSWITRVEPVLNGKLKITHQKYSEQKSEINWEVRT